MLGILCEKPSAAKNFAKALGGMSGTFDGVQYRITASHGHLFEFLMPDKQVIPALFDKYHKWDLSGLPWNENDFKWERGKKEGASSTLSQIKNDLSGCDEIAIATDDDPTGEGELLAWEILDELHLKPQRWSRFFFADESVKEVQKAFKNRKPIISMDKDPDFLQADFRSKFDFLSMQFTRIAACLTGAKLRQGRLKSAMVSIVGAQLDLVNNYKKVPFYQVRFRDGNQNMFTDSEMKQHSAKEDCEAEIKSYTDSPVIVDSKELKHTAPPALLDLASLSAMLSSKGIKAKLVLDVYQKMYEDQIVSYPRTEDKFVSPEQFNDLLPHIDAIAKVVGVDTSLLTHRSLRSTHIKAGGAHGANRPGLSVPSSLDALAQKYGSCAPEIYSILAKNYLAMFCEDYEYEAEKAHLEKYPSFKSNISIAKKPGWKAVFNNSDDDDDKMVGFAATAAPFVFEGFPPKPTAPTMKWLMKQLEKRDVGTGATRTSIYADVTNEKSKDALMSEKKGKLSLTDLGRESYLILPDTHIGSVEITEDMQKDMKLIYEGKTTGAECLKKMAQLVLDDIETMKKNLPSVQKEFSVRTGAVVPKVKGSYKGQQVEFNPVWGGHKFTDEEIKTMLSGEKISFEATAKDGNKYEVTGGLSEQTYKGHKFWGFKRDDTLGGVKNDPDKITGFYKGKKEISFKKVWSGHEFTDEEVKKLLAGEEITFQAKSAKTQSVYTAKGKLAEQTYNGHKFWGFKADFGK